MNRAYRMLLTVIAMTTLPIWAATTNKPTAVLAPATPQPVQVSTTQATVRVKDIARVQGARDNQLLGYGLVVGLNGTGDTNKTLFSNQMLSSMLQKAGIVVSPTQLTVKNVAAVMVTANIGPFMKSGDHLDVTVSSLGDATSLQGGVLLQTPLAGADNNVYAVAQGAVSLGGFSASSGGASMSSGQPTAGRVPSGALIEREIPMDIAPGNVLSLSLNYPDFATAARMAEVLNTDLTALGGDAHARDAATVDVTVPPSFHEKLVELVARIGDDTLQVDTPAKVVINERTGTVVVGGNVKVSPVAVAQGDLAISVNPAFFVSQPDWMSQNGTTVAKETANIKVKNPAVSMTMVQGTTVEELVRSLNRMKVSPRDIIAILQALKQSGALQAEMEIM